MPIIGNLSEFPLPEVLLLIGTRTGRLRLLDVPEFGLMNIDFSEGEVQGLRIGSQTLTAAADLLSKLSAVVQAQDGMFEFTIHPVVSVARTKPLMVNELVISLVCYVDEQIARERMPDLPHQWYIMEEKQPEIWIEPELNVFFHRAKSHLATGAHCNDLAERLGMEISLVHKNLTNLRLLGLIKLVNGAETVPIKEMEVEEKISRKSNEFLRASRAATEIKKVTGRLQGLTMPMKKVT